MPGIIALERMTILRNENAAPGTRKPGTAEGKRHCLYRNSPEGGLLVKTPRPAKGLLVRTRPEDEVQNDQDNTRKKYGSRGMLAIHRCDRRNCLIYRWHWPESADGLRTIAAPGTR